MKKAFMKITGIMLIAALLAGCALPLPGKDDSETAEQAGGAEDEAVQKPSARDVAALMGKTGQEEPDLTEDASAEISEDGDSTEYAGTMIFTEEDCENAIERLLNSEPVHPANAELLKEMGQMVTFSKVIGAYGEIFSQMDDMKKAWLRHQILSAVVWGGPAFQDAIDVDLSDGRYEGDGVVDVKEAESLFRDVYGEENFRPAGSERVVNTDLVLSFGDGDPWVIVEHMQFFEDDTFILLSGPAFYEDNSGASEYEGYADILLAKNPNSRFGVTLLYGRYRVVYAPVVSVETSSELPPSKDKTYSGDNLVDGNLATAWAEGVPGTGVGETVTLHLDKKRPVYGIQITNGYMASYDLYTKNGMLTAVSVDFGGKTVEAEIPEGYGYEEFSQEVLAECNRSRIELDEPVVTDTVTVTITGAKRGTKYDDTCVTEMYLY